MIRLGMEATGKELYEFLIYVIIVLGALLSYKLDKKERKKDG